MLKKHITETENGMVRAHSVLVDMIKNVKKLRFARYYQRWVVRYLSPLLRYIATCGPPKW